MAAASAFAQSSVTVYGIVDIGAVSNKDEGAAASRSTSGFKGGNQSGNRLGFKGTEDIGGGTKANFVIETGFEPIGTNTSLFGNRDTAAGHAVVNATAQPTSVAKNENTITEATNRQSWVGLQGNAGEVRLGYQYSLDYTITSLSGIQSTTEAVRGGTAHLNTNIASRAAGVTYLSPKIANTTFVGFIARTTDKTDSEATNTNVYNLGGIYANGPLTLAASIGSLKTTGTLAAVATNATTTPWNDIRTAGAYDRPETKTTVLGASYDLGVAKVGATMGKKVASNQTTADRFNTTTTHQQYSVSYPMGKTVLVGSYAKWDAQTLGYKMQDWKQYQVGVNYNFSKRTNAYAYMGQEKNSDEAVANAASSAIQKVKTTAVGIRHQF